VRRVLQGAADWAELWRLSFRTAAASAPGRGSAHITSLKWLYFSFARSSATRALSLAHPSSRGTVSPGQRRWTEGGGAQRTLIEPLDFRASGQTLLRWKRPWRQPPRFTVCTSHQSLTLVNCPGPASAQAASDCVRNVLRVVWLFAKNSLNCRGTCSASTQTCTVHQVHPVGACWALSVDCNCRMAPQLNTAIHLARSQMTKPLHHPRSGLTLNAYTLADPIERTHVNVRGLTW
jgi:hypothetical protein